MVLDPSSMLSYITTILGTFLLTFIVIFVIIMAIVSVLLAYSFKTGKVLFPDLIVIGIMFCDGPIRAIFLLFNVDDSVIDRISIDMQNQAMWAKFIKIPFEKRAVFVPQCLRSVDCPARLSPEGIQCKDCGRCEITKAKKAAEKLGYMFFVVPGSSFIIRMIRKYDPKAIIGVGCLCEVKDGLDLLNKNRIPAIGVVLDRSGCVNTILDWKKLYEIMESGKHIDVQVNIRENAIKGIKT